MNNLSNHEILTNLKNAIPRYRENFNKVKKYYAEGKKDNVFSSSVEEDLGDLIKYTGEILDNMDKSIILATCGDFTGESLEKIVKELLGYHEYILNADIYLLVFIKEEYESCIRLEK